MKYCSKCEKFKEETDFQKDSSKSDGLCSYCKVCRSETKKKYSNKPDIAKKIKEYGKEYYEKNKEKLLEHGKEYSKEYYKKNREASIKKALEWRKNNPEKHKENKKRYKSGTIQKRIRTVLSKKFALCIKKNGIGTCEILEKHLGYTLKQLYEHLEGLFKEGMTWDNYGSGKDRWCIDHIIPQSSFSYTSYEDEDFKKCWALNNLQPMWFNENSSKSNKLDWTPTSI